VIRFCVALDAPLRPEAVETALRLGAWGVDLALPVAPAAAADAVRAAAIQVRTSGLRLVTLRCPRNAAAVDPAVRRRAAADLAAALDLAAQTDALFVGTGAGHRDPERPEEPFVPHADNTRPEALDAVVATCRAALAAAAPGSPRLLLAPRAGSPVPSLLAAAEAVRRVADPRFGILFDPVDLMNLDTYFDNASFLGRWVQQLGAALAAVHARDVLVHPDQLGGRLVEVPVGEGALDYAALLGHLAALPGDVPVSVAAAGGDAALAAALQHLRTAAARAGVPWG
jgi:sugar phosphate isomerase/epimerase